jgi:hypothetical protein
VFTTDEALLHKAAQILAQRKRLHWVIGGACSGKSTICRAVAARTGVPIYDMDEAVFGRWQFDAERHPATTAWFTAGNPLGWLLSLPWPEFDALYRAANAEYLDLLAVELAGQPDTPLLIDGGITHPSVLAQVIPAEQIVCLETSDLWRSREWETSPGRAEMKGWVLALPDGEAMWRRFLDYDRRMTATIGRESRQSHIPVFSWDSTIEVSALVDEIINHWSLPITQSVDIEQILSEAQKMRELTAGFSISDDEFNTAKNSGRL